MALTAAHSPAKARASAGLRPLTAASLSACSMAAKSFSPLAGVPRTPEGVVAVCRLVVTALASLGLAVEEGPVAGAGMPVAPAPPSALPVGLVMAAPVCPDVLGAPAPVGLVPAEPDGLPPATPPEAACPVALGPLPPAALPAEPDGLPPATPPEAASPVAPGPFPPAALPAEPDGLPPATPPEAASPVALGPLPPAALPAEPDESPPATPPEAASPVALWA